MNSWGDGGGGNRRAPGNSQDLVKTAKACAEAVVQVGLHAFYTSKNVEYHATRSAALRSTPTSINHQCLSPHLSCFCLCLRQRVSKASQDVEEAQRDFDAAKNTMCAKKKDIGQAQRVYDASRRVVSAKQEVLDQKKLLLQSIINIKGGEHFYSLFSTVFSCAWLARYAEFVGCRDHWLVPLPPCRCRRRRACCRMALCWRRFTK